MVIVELHCPGKGGVWSEKRREVNHIREKRPFSCIYRLKERSLTMRSTESSLQGSISVFSAGMANDSC